RRQSNNRRLRRLYRIERAPRARTVSETAQTCATLHSLLFTSIKNRTRTGGIVRMSADRPSTSQLGNVATSNLQPASLELLATFTLQPATFDLLAMFNLQPATCSLQPSQPAASSASYSPTRLNEPPCQPFTNGRPGQAGPFVFGY